MEDLFRFPLLDRLRPVERSKLLPFLQEIELTPGWRLERSRLAEAIYFVRSGRIELRFQDDSSEVRLFSLGAAEFIGEALLAPGNSLPLVAVALEPTQLVAVPLSAFQQLLAANSHVLEAFTGTLLARCSGNLEELAHLRRMLAAYTDLFKEQVRTGGPPSGADETAVRQSAVALQANLHDGPADPGTPGDYLSKNYRLVGLGLATVISLIILVVPAGESFDVQSRRFLAALSWGAVCWLFSALPDYVVGLATCLGIGLSGPEASTIAWSGFSHPTWFLLLGVWVIGVACGRTGLLYRMALVCLRFAPPTYLGRSLALALAGVVMTPLLPSPQGRIVMAAPLTQELGEAMQFPSRSTGSAGLAMASFLGFGEMYFLFLNGTTSGLLAWSLLPDATRTQVTWGFWFLAALPLGIMIFVLSFWAIMRLLPAGQVPPVDSSIIQRQLTVLGPVKKDEWLALGVVAMVLVGFVTAAWHGIDAGWFAMAGASVLISTGVVDRESLSRDVNWSFLLFFGSILGIAAAARIVHLDAALGEFIHPLMVPALSHPIAAVTVTCLITLLLRLALSSIQVIPLLTIVLSPIFAAAGYSPFGAVLTILAASTTFAAPMLSPAYVSMLAGTREMMFTNQQIQRLALVHSLILVGALVVTAPYWVLIQAL